MDDKAKILVADSSRTHAELIGYILRESGYEVAMTANAEEALGKINDIKPDLIVSDLIMPGMKRDELCKAIRTSLTSEYLPVLMLTKPTGPEEIVSSLESGADSFLIKPFGEEALLERTKILLQGKDSKNRAGETGTYRLKHGRDTYEAKTSRKSILDMLVAFGESAVQDNIKLQDTREDLVEMNAALDQKVREGSIVLQEKLEQIRSMEAQINQHREHYERLARNANVGIMILDREGRIEFANAALAKILDVRSEKLLIGKQFSDSFHSREQFAIILEKLDTAGKLQDEELKLYTPKHMPRWVTMNLVAQDNRISGMVFDRTGKKFMQERDLHYRDVLRNAKEKAEWSDRQKSYFLKGMANQVKGPINLITGYASLLSENGLETEQMRLYKNKIRLSVFELRNKISHILDLSRIEAGKVKPVENELPVVQKCREVCKEFGKVLELLGKESIKIRCISGELDEQVIIITDSNLFLQVIRILLNNAVKYTESGNIDLVLYREESKLRVHVKDTGTGIPESLLQEIFRQKDIASSPYNSMEMGLGLPVAQMLADLLGGSIRVESSPERGSDFYFTIPLVERKQDSFQENVEELAYHISHLNNKTILVAEDIYDNYLLLTAYLEHTGARIIWVQDGDEAIRKFESGVSIDLILMDLKMPGKDGLQAIHAIRRVNKEIPIIVITAYVSKEYRAKAREAQVNAFISKPVEQDELMETLADCIAGKNAIEHG